MKLIANSEHYGLAWYASTNSRGGDEHTVLYGLKVERCSSFEEAKRTFQTAMDHAAEAAGEVSYEDDYS